MERQEEAFKVSSTNARTHTHHAHGMTKTQTHVHTKAGRHTCAQGDMQTGAYTCIHVNTDHTQCTHVPFRSCVGRWSVECCGTGFVLPQSLAEATEAQVLPLLLGRSVCTAHRGALDPTVSRQSEPKHPSR